MMRLGLTPMIRAASTYSLRRSTMVEARTMRAYCTQPVSAIDSTRIAAEKLSRSDCGSSSRNTALTRIATSNVGIDSTVSPIRISRLSIRPPKKPAISPTVTPIVMASTTLRAR